MNSLDRDSKPGSTLTMLPIHPEVAEVHRKCRKLSHKLHHIYCLLRERILIYFYFYLHFCVLIL